MSLIRTVSPIIEPVTPAEVKTYARVDGSTEDYLIYTWIKSARIKAENYQRRSYLTQTWRLTTDSFADVIYLPRGPLQSLTSITYQDSNGTSGAVDITKFIVNTDVSTITLKGTEDWPDLTSGTTLDNLKITYSAGYGSNAKDVPEYVADAIYIYCAYRYENRLGETDVIPRVFFQILDEERHFRGI